MKLHFKMIETGLNSGILPDSQHFSSSLKLNKYNTINLWWVMPVSASAGSGSGSWQVLFKNNTVMLDGDDFGECVAPPFSALAVKIKVVIL